MFFRILIASLLLSFLPSPAFAQESTLRVIWIENDTVCGWEADLAVFQERKDIVPKAQLYNVLRTCRELDRPTNFLVPDQGTAAPTRWKVLRIYLPPANLTINPEDVEVKIDLAKCLEMKTCSEQFITVPGARPS
jgi:hypothetical protein